MTIHLEQRIARMERLVEKQRTELQNKSLHLYLELVARELANQGQTMQEVVKKVNWLEITPTKTSIKEVLWRPIQETVVGKKSTTELSTAEVNKIYEIMSMFLSKQFGIALSFPSELDTKEYLKSFINISLKD